MECPLFHRSQTLIWWPCKAKVMAIISNRQGLPTLLLSLSMVKGKSFSLLGSLDFLKNNRIFYRSYAPTPQFGAHQPVGSAATYTPMQPSNTPSQMAVTKYVFLNIKIRFEYWAHMLGGFKGSDTRWCYLKKLLTLKKISCVLGPRPLSLRSLKVRFLSNTKLFMTYLKILRQSVCPPQFIR